ncbi:MAG TPA: cupin domain-containing protein [Thermoanaerobaculia bacterium]|nr:cupin domain-containing protein [Thermoanaerobaculia bacterium]
MATAPFPPPAAAFNLSELAARRAASGETWLQFFQTATLRTGLYVLPAGGVDDQTPHAEDEIYHVLSGRAVLNIGGDIEGEAYPVAAGSVLYVRAGVAHRFHSIEEELSVLVFFGGRPVGA